MYSPIENNPQETYGRILALERKLAALENVQQEQGGTIQQVVEKTSRPVEYHHQNHIRNGDLDFTRNTYLYDTDFAGGTGEDANVSEEAAWMFAHPEDTCVDTTGSVAAASTALTIDTADFVAGDAGVEIVVYGAGAAGADLVTTINGVPGSATTCTLSVAATTAVTNARVRFRLLELKQDSTDENDDANLATNTTLKTSSHTRYATTVSNPDWDKTNGWLRWSDAGYTLTCPLAYNTVIPSKQYILTFIYKLANDVDGASEVFVDFYAGLWDNTAGQRKFLEGTQPGLSATVVGTTGATSRDYMVLMYLGDGSTVATETVTVANTNATIDDDNYVQLSWTQEAGTVRSEVYRKTGATYERLGFPYPASTYYDRGLVNNSVGGFPTPTRSQFIAKTQVTEADFQPASSQEWRVGQINIVVPSTYDKSKTTDQQWFVLGFNTSLTGVDSTRALLIDRISLDDTYGLFSRCPIDFTAKRGVSTQPTSGDQGTTGGDTGGLPPGGGGYCPVFSDLILTDHGELPASELIDNEHKYKIVNRNGQAVGYSVTVNPPQEVYTLLAGDYKITASRSHPVFTADNDIVGKPLYRFQEGDIIYTKSGQVRVDALIKHFKKRHTVLISLEGQEKGFWQNGVAVHNRKYDDVIY